MTKDLKNKTLSELEKIIAGLGSQKYLAKYIFSFIHTKNVNDINQITPLSKILREKLLSDGYFISQIKIADKLIDSDGTAKYLFELSDASRIESVLLPSSQRQTVCISTQVGCAMNCVFCATGKVKFERNLTAAEIVDQFNAITKDCGEKITNVVYMGMGEPLNNYDALLKAIRILNEPNGKNIGVRRQTISTCGQIDGIKRLAQENIFPRLAVSLNASTDKVRSKLMPVNLKYPISNVMHAVKFYQSNTKARVTFEYVMLKGLNDSIQDARRLAELLKGLICNINLIEYNPHPNCELKGTEPAEIKRFGAVLEKSGFETSIRFKMGRKIKAACGQLGAGGFVKSDDSQ
ncbi:MAG: 23S rRNA (adenine(2503)-C(2))-methyltransferase RlmN [Phycisphaerae bacterium]